MPGKNEHVSSSILGTMGTQTLHFLLWAELSGDVLCGKDAWLN